MAAKHSESAELRQIYPIPDNFMEGTGVLGGIVKLRNLIEGCILALPAFLIFWNIPIESINVKMAVIALFTAGPLLLGCIGINGDCVSRFLGYFFWFRKNRRIMRYNPRVKLEYTGDIPVTREVPVDKLRKLLTNLSQDDNLLQSESDLYYAVDQGIAFEDDIALQKRLKAKTEQRRKAHEKR